MLKERQTSASLISYLWPHSSNMSIKSRLKSKWTNNHVQLKHNKKYLEDFDIEFVEFSSNFLLHSHLAQCWASSWKESTVFENHPKYRIWVYQFWHFPPIFVLLKVTCLVILFDRKLQIFKNSPKWTIFGLLMNFCPLKM